jgi:hypothetical protein
MLSEESAVTLICPPLKDIEFAIPLTPDAQKNRIRFRRRRAQVGFNSAT